MTKSCKRIVILGNGFSDWGGGIDFVRFCANALALVCDDCTKITLLLPDPDNSTILAKIKKHLIPYKRMLKCLIAAKLPAYSKHKSFSKAQLTDSFSNIDGKLEIIFYQQGIDIAAVVTSLRTDVIIPSVYSLGTSFPVPWVGYLYDFQHKYYPDYFTNIEIKKREAPFNQMLDEASAVIVNAADVKKDILKFYPQTKCAIFDLPFSATPVESWFGGPSEDFTNRYNLPKKYFVICNQFWIHKDHVTAFRALDIFRKEIRQNDVHIVCTGNTIDPRHPNYFSSLKKTVSQLGLTDRIHFLGHIPKKDQIGIMCASIAVLQPTLFEGGPGGGSVYDAVAMGVPAIISDIPVNKEIEGFETIIFFKVKDASDMASKMIQVQHMGFVRRNKDYLLSAGRQRTIKFGLRLLEAIEYVMEK